MTVFLAAFATGSLALLSGWCLCQVGNIEGPRWWQWCNVGAGALSLTGSYTAIYWLIEL